MSTLDLTSRNLRLVEARPVEPLGRPWLFVHAVRTSLLVCILLVAILYQIRLGNFLNVGIWIPVYATLLTSFAVNSIYLLFFDTFKEKIFWNALIFSLDTVAVTLLIYFTGTNESLFLFLYLVNLILGTLVFSAEGAWLLALWTSMCFSALLIVSPEVSGQNLYFSLIVNNVAFLAVTLLSGRLAEQLSQAGSRLQEAQVDLLVLQNLNENIVTNITTGILVISRTGFVQFFNPSAARILSADHFQQLKIQEILPDLSWPWPELVEDESKSFERREVYLEREGQHQILEVVVTRLREPNGSVRGWILLVDDRTDQKQMEENLRQQEKLAAVGQLAAGIAHEIRNPLASISGSIQLMLAEPQSHSEEHLKLMRIVDKEIDRLNGLITEFLDYVRPEARATAFVNVNNVLREVLDSLQFNPKLRKDVEQKVELKAQSEILGHRDKLKQAFLNFVINAYQAMDKTPKPVLEVQTFDQSESVILILQDNGCGIKKENLNRIFEPFHTTKPSGTGLGLAVTHKILQAHDARIAVHSTEGEGTRFVIEFPAHKDFHTEDLIPLRDGSKG